ERLAAGLMILRTNVTRRLERYGRVLRAIDHEALYTPDSALMLTPQEQIQVLQALSGDVYAEPFRLYVLRRLDAALSGATRPAEFPLISVEHVLPQHPGQNSQWFEDFSDTERDEWVGRI